MHLGHVEVHAYPIASIVLEFMACKEKPVAKHSMLAWVTRSLMASSTFFNRFPCTILVTTLFRNYKFPTQTMEYAGVSRIKPCRLETEENSFI
jgi:hypothetical protein